MHENTAEETKSVPPAAQTGTEASAAPQGSSAINKPLVVSDKTFSQTVKRYPLIIIDSWASWCGPCRSVAPIIEQLAAEYSGRVVFGKLNVDENPVTSQRFSIMAIPTLLVMKDGKEFDRIVGALPKESLRERIDSYLQPG